MTITQTISVTRTGPVLKPDQTRVLLRPFEPGDKDRMAGIAARIMSLPEHRVGPILDSVLGEFSERHEHIKAFFRIRFEQVRDLLPPDGAISEQRKLVIGAYFVSEFSMESSALFNPSIVPHPDQSELPPGSLRFILSLRATGEGHISSIVFREGTIDANHRVTIVPPGGYVTEPRQVANPAYEKPLFERKLFELGLTNDFTKRVMQKCGVSFTLEDLRRLIDEETKQYPQAEHQNTAQGMWMLAKSNYQVHFREDQALSERVIFPATPAQRNGVEDARFVCFRNDDGSSIYYATFTAFDGRVILPELLSTPDFLHFRFNTLNGPASQNKGMAVFPRKLNGRYAMLSRQDNENIFVMFSDNMHFWNERQLVIRPEFEWELVQIGNCGSPIETDAGWLVLSHGVGPVRSYSIGAFLLDRDDPTKVIGRLREPLLKPNRNEREGYVPNVVYSCGALVHRGELIVPYAMSDYATGFAITPLREVIDAMTT